MKLSTLKMTEVIIKCFFLILCSCLLVSHPWYDHNRINNHISFRNIVQRLWRASVASAQWQIAAVLIFTLLTVYSVNVESFSSPPALVVFMSPCGRGASVSLSQILTMFDSKLLHPRQNGSSFNLEQIQRKKLGPIHFPLLIVDVVLLFLQNEESWVRSQRVEREETGLAAMAVVYKIERCSKIMNVLMAFWIVNHRFHSFEGQQEFKRQWRTECSFESHLKWRWTVWADLCQCSCHGLKNKGFINKRPPSIFRAAADFE